MVNLESTQVRIDRSFPVIYSGYGRSGGARKQPDEQLISGIDRALQVRSEIGPGFSITDAFFTFFFVVFFVLKQQGTMGEKSKKPNR